MIRYNYELERELLRLKQYVDDLNVVIPAVGEEYEWFFQPDHMEGVYH